MLDIAGILEKRHTKANFIESLCERWEFYGNAISNQLDGLFTIMVMV